MGGEKIVHSIAGVELVRKFACDGVRIFTAEQARERAPEVGLSAGYLRLALHHLVKSGWIVRLRGGLYALSSSVPGVSTVHEFEVAMALVHPAAISHWSALHYHQLTEQAPGKVFVLTTAKIPRGPKKNTEEYSAGGSLYQFIQLKPDRYFGTQNVWIGEAKVAFTDPERTLLDGLCMPRYCGDFAEVLHAFEVRGTKLDLERIISYALRLDAATVKRLGWVLEQQGIPPALLVPLLELPIKGYRVLDSSGPAKGPCNKRWMIQENLPGRIGN